MRFESIICHTLLLVGVSMVIPYTNAQHWPTSVVKLVVPYAPKGYLDPLFVVPADVRVNDLNELLNGCALPVSRIEQLRCEPPEEALAG